MDSGDGKVSKSTLQRDLAFLRDSVNWPIEFDAKMNGFYLTGAPEKLNRLGIKEDDLFGVMVLEPIVKKYEGTPIGHQLKQTFAKIKGQMEADLEVSASDVSEAMSIRETKVPQQNLDYLRVLLGAVKDRRYVDMMYTLPNKPAKPYKIAPIHCASINGTWYLYAAESVSKKIRNFKLSRVTEVNIDTKAKPFPPQKFNIKDYTDWGVIKGKEQVDVELRFAASCAQALSEKQWHESQKLSYNDDGSVRVRFKLYSDFKEFRSWLLSWGGAVEVIKPDNLREQMLNSGKSIACRHGYDFEDDDDSWR